MAFYKGFFFLHAIEAVCKLFSVCVKPDMFTVCLRIVCNTSVKLFVMSSNVTSHGEVICESYAIIDIGLSFTYKSSNIGKTTTTNQCRRVPDLWRSGSVKIKRYYTKSGRLIPTAKRGKEIKRP